MAVGRPGAQVVEADAGRTVVEVADDRDDIGQALLAAALGAGPVHEFGRQRPSLSDLYRDVVTGEPREEQAS